MIVANKISLDTPLEQISLWHRYKTRVWFEESETSKTVHNIMRLLRAVRFYGHVEYLSIPVTSGKVLYNLMRDQPQKTKGELIGTAIVENHALGFNEIGKLRNVISHPVIFPADLTPVHQKWEQAHFQALWLSIIAEFCTIVRMVKGWEYSNGACEELTHSFQLKLGIPKHPGMVFFNTKGDERVERARMRAIKVIDHNGKPITISDAIQKMQHAVEWITMSGFSAPNIEECIALLRIVRKKILLGIYQ